MNLAQMTRFSGDNQGVADGRALLTAFLDEPLIRNMEFSPDTSDYLQEALAASADVAAITRAEGAALQRVNITGSPTLGKLALYGKEYSIDDVKKFDGNIGASPEFIRNRALRNALKQIKKLREDFAKHRIQGVGNASPNTEMYGLATLIKDAETSAGQTAFGGYSVSDIHSMLTRVQIDLTTKIKILQFMELLQREIALVPGANGLLMNTFLAGRILTGARLLHVLGSAQDSFNIPLNTVFGIPMIVGTTDMIPNTDVWSGHSLATSLYIVRNAELSGLDYPSNSGFAYSGFDDDDTPLGISRIQVFTNTRLNDVNCVRRLSEIGLQALIDKDDPVE
ncbi:MAG: hypothetical protein PHN44_04245 [Candidatus Marinimicrobia bacterium]|jgi:hypothetical protein|nr:hypothetical protein [Candidatus Neomarinimicrobiota bacterium]MDD5539503.1 hypothetical protein [Candidatus Neomarinimicrobiota bacterium]